jgi:DNA-binding NarL/FixJ family response regulator
MYYKNTLDEIRSSIIQALGFRNLASGSDFKVSLSDIKQAKFYMFTGTLNRGHIYQIEVILKEALDPLISIERIDRDSLLLNVSKVYFQNQKKNEPEKPAVKESPIVNPAIDPFTLELIVEKQVGLEELPEEPRMNVINVEFTEEEQDVFNLLCEWRSKSEITSMLGLIDNQFSRIKESIFLKLKVKDVTGVVIVAYKNGLYLEDSTTNDKLEFNDVEKKIIECICKGLKITTISIRVSRPVNSIRHYQHEILEKINGKTSADIIVYALKHKLFSG